MTRSAVVILALLVVNCVPARAQGSPGFAWPQHPRLRWDDFKGSPPKSASYPSAVSDTGFKYQLVCGNGLLDIDSVLLAGRLLGEAGRQNA
jgi:hypothetical protein